MCARTDFGGTTQNFLRTASSQIVFENLIRIVEIAEDQIEAAEIIAQIEWKLRVSREEAGKCTVFYRSDGIGIKSFICDGRDMRVTEDFHSRLQMGGA